MFKVHPPLRTERDVAAIRAGLADGTIDAIATDHAPHTPESKERVFEEAPPGMLGLETALALTLTELVEPGHLNLRTALGALSWRPAEIAGLRDQGGALEVGRVANIAVIDPAVKWEVDPLAPRQPRPQHALPRPQAHRQGAPHHLPRRARRHRRRGHPMSNHVAVLNPRRTA